MKEKKILEEIARFRKLSNIDENEQINEGVLGDILKTILFGNKDLTWEEILDLFFAKLKNKIEKKKNYPDTWTGDKSDFSKMTNFIIDKIEGGYYNPKWHYKKAMGKSGETLFGIDREHGKYLGKTVPGIEFWNIVDKNKNPEVWVHGYRGGENEQKLRSLVVDMMETAFNNQFKKYVNEETRKIVETDIALMFHFIYATWNGSGYFQKFGQEMNQAVADGITDIDELRNVAINSRIEHTGQKRTDKFKRLVGELTGEQIV